VVVEVDGAVGVSNDDVVGTKFVAREFVPDARGVGEVLVDRVLAALLVMTDGLNLLDAVLGAVHVYINPVDSKKAAEERVEEDGDDREEDAVVPLSPLLSYFQPEKSVGVGGLLATLHLGDDVVDLRGELGHEDIDDPINYLVHLN